MVNADGTKSYDLYPETQIFNRYEILVGLGVITIDQVPESVYEDVAKLGLHGKKDSAVTAETFKQILAEETDPKNGKYLVDTQDLLSSIQNAGDDLIDDAKRAIRLDDTVRTTDVAYKFAKYGVNGLSNSELEDLSKLMMEYANYWPELGDKIGADLISPNVMNIGIKYALLQAGINEGKIDTNIKSTDVERQKALNDLYFGYERLSVSNEKVQFERDGISRLNVAATSALGVVATGLCDASGGSHHSCTGAGEVGAAFGGAFGSAFVQKVVPSLAVGKNEPVIQKVDTVNTYPLQDPVKAESIRFNDPNLYKRELARQSGIPEYINLSAPKGVYGLDAQKLKTYFEMNGFRVNVEKDPLKGSGNAQVYSIYDHKEIGKVQYSPSTANLPIKEQSQHVGEYIKFTLKDGNVDIYGNKKVYIINPDTFKGTAGKSTFYNQQGQKLDYINGKYLEAK